MTLPTPTDTTVTAPPVAAAPTEQTTEVVAVAEKLVRTKTFLKKTFKNVGVPVLIGMAAAAVATRKGSNDEDADATVIDGEIIDSTVE